jgi:hypothetical protein
MNGTTNATETTIRSPPNEGMPGRGVKVRFRYRLSVVTGAITAVRPFNPAAQKAAHPTAEAL